MVLSHDNIQARLHGVDAFTNDTVFPAMESGKIVLHPMPTDLDAVLGPCGVDLRLGQTITTVEAPLDGRPVNPLDPEDYKRIRHTKYDITEQPFVLRSGMFVLGETHEEVGIPVDLVGFVRDKSRWARVGVTICLNSPKVDPGFHGVIVLEINNRGPLNIPLAYKMPITQMIFFMMASNPTVPYHKRKSSSYSGQQRS